MPSALRREFVYLCIFPSTDAGPSPRALLSLPPLMLALLPVAVFALTAADAGIVASGDVARAAADGSKRASGAIAIAATDAGPRPLAKFCRPPLTLA